MTHILLDIKYFHREEILIQPNLGEKMIYDWVKFNNHNLIQKPVMYVFPPPSEYKNTKCNDNDYQGYTGFGILLESHISIHTYPENNCITIDFYSCKQLDEKCNNNFIKKYFQKNKNDIFSIQFIERNII